MYDKFIPINGESLNNPYETYLNSERARLDNNIVVPKTSMDYYDYYTITKGDSLYSIARKFNINPSLLASINGLNMDDYIYPGQRLIIPKSGYSYYITADGDTLETVANTFNTTKDKVLEQNKTIYLLAGQLLVYKK